MALALLFLFLSLLGTMQTKHQSLHPTDEVDWVMEIVSMQMRFKYEELEGKWYSLAIANGKIENGTTAKLNMHSVIYRLTGNRGYLLTRITYRPYFQHLATHKHVAHHPECDYWVRNFSGTHHPRHFILQSPHGYHGIWPYTMRVEATNYNEYVILSFGPEFQDMVYTIFMLYGRTKELSPLVKKRFLYFTKFHHLTEDNIIFHVPIEKCMDYS